MRLEKKDKEEKRKGERCIYQRKMEINEQFGRKMNEGIGGNWELFRREVIKVNRKVLDSCNGIKDGNGKLALGENKVRRIRKDNFEDLYKIETQKHVEVHMCSYDGVQNCNYFGGEQIRKTEVEVREGKLKRGRLQVRMRPKERSGGCAVWILKVV